MEKNIIDIYFCQVKRSSEYWPWENKFDSRSQLLIDYLGRIVDDLNRSNFGNEHKFNIKNSSETYQNSSKGTKAILLAIGNSGVRTDTKILTELVQPQVPFNNGKSVPPYRVISESRDIKPGNYWPQPMIFLGYDLLTREPGWTVSKWPGFMFLDSSIWHHYISIKRRKENLRKENSSIAWEAQFVETLKKIAFYHEKKIYQTVISREFLEYQCRKLKNSYFIKIGTGHADDVTPLRFHSETNFEKSANELEKEIRRDGLQWGYLILDDYADEELRIENREKSHWTKQDAIDYLVNGRQDKPIIKKLNGEEKVEQGQNFLEFGRDLIYKYPQADLILLDYFLGKYVGFNAKTRYSPTLLEFLKKDKEYDQRSGTFERHVGAEEFWSQFGKRLLERMWIFPISVFDESFKSHLKATGQIQYDDEFVIAEGADPVNTPQLFRFLLLSFLKAQQKAAGMSLSDDLVQYLEKLGKKDQASESEIQDFKHAADLFYSSITSYYARINKQYNTAGWEIGVASNGSRSKSLLAQSFLSQADPHHKLKLFALHLQHLMNLIAYGTGQQIGQMWEEYALLKEYFEAIPFLPKKESEKHATRDLLRNLIEAIEKYLGHLQKAF